MALAALGVLPGWGRVAAAGVLAGAAAWAFARSGREPGLGLAAAWAPLHLVIAAAGGLGGPLVPLAGAWAYLLGRRLPRAAPWLAGGAAVVLPAAAWLHGDPPAPAALGAYLLLLALATAAAVLPRGRFEPRRPVAERGPPLAPAPGDEPADGAALDGALELVRVATGAHEATLWRAESGEPPAAWLLGRAAAEGVPDAEPAVVLEGHPFGWAVDEQMPVRLERGRRDLPAPWAAEMLLVPVGDPRGVLALGYADAAPADAEAVALGAGGHVSAFVRLLGVRADGHRAEARVLAMADAVRTLPGELELNRFAAHLAATVCRGTGAAGAAVALAPDETGRGRILHVAEGDGEPPTTAEGFGDGDSRMALAAKHATELAYPDLRQERDRLPLLTPNERWAAPPRSAAILPLIADGRAIGVVAAWHPRPGCFGEREMELLRVLCSIAPLPMRSARKYEALDHRASTDPLTALPNRSEFERRLATLSGYFDRYARPFALIVLDIDHFKGFNDTWGHEAGDRVLRHVADLLRGAVRDVDLPARLGGEEFVVLLPETCLRDAMEAAERIRRTLESRGVVWQGRSLSVTASIGVASAPDCTEVPVELLGAADAALYRAKEAGRNRVAAAPQAARPRSAGVGPG